MKARSPPLDLYGAWCQGCRKGHLLVRLADDISSSRLDFPSDAARSGRQGWPKAIAQLRATFSRFPATAALQSMTRHILSSRGTRARRLQRLTLLLQLPHAPNGCPY